MPGISLTISWYLALFPLWFADISSVTPTSLIFIYFTLFSFSSFHRVAQSHYHVNTECVSSVSISFLPFSYQPLEAYLRDGILLPLIKPAGGNLGDGGHGWWRSSTNLSKAEWGLDFCSPSIPQELPPNSPPPPPPLPPPPATPPWWEIIPWITETHTIMKYKW